jgi:hypothetical protein
MLGHPMTVACRMPRQLAMHYAALLIVACRWCMTRAGKCASWLNCPAMYFPSIHSTSMPRFAGPSRIPSVYAVDTTQHHAAR